MKTMKTMKTTFLLLCAGLALTDAAAVPETDDVKGEEQLNELTEDEFIQEAAPQTEAEELTGRLNQSRSRMSYWSPPLCPSSWKFYSNHCFLYVPTGRTWAWAEKDCLARGGNLASVHSHGEYVFIQEMIWEVTREYPVSWIGGSDAQQEDVWLWSDGSDFTYVNWCPGEPNNYHGRQHCMQMNFGAGKCWDDAECYIHRPYVCAQDVKRISSSLIYLN